MIEGPSTPVVIVSNDTHIGPRLVEALRPYCPKQHLDEFDGFAAEATESKAAATQMLQGSGYLDHPNFRTLGHHDSAARLADYDHDGIAAGVMFHGSMNLEPIPFIAQELGKPTASGDHELAGVGMQIYNRWLADFVSQAPHRHIGLAYIPMSDVDAAVAEVEWAHARRPAREQLPRHARRRPARVQPEALGAVVGDLRRAPHAPRHPRRRRHQCPVLGSRGRGPPADRVRRVHLAAGNLVAHLRRRLRTPPRAEVRDHRDPRQLVPQHRRRARCRLGVLRRQARRAAQPGAARTGAPSAERIHGEQRVLRGQLRVAVRGLPGGRQLQRHAAALGLGLPPPRGHLREPRGPGSTVGDAPRAPPHLLWALRRGHPPDGGPERHRRLRTRCRRSPSRGPRDRGAHARGARNADRRRTRGRQPHGVPIGRRWLGLRLDGFHQCITATTREAVPADVLEGTSLTSTIALGATDDPTFELYEAVIDAYGDDVRDVDNATG